MPTHFLKSITLVVHGSPPWKQVPVDQSESTRQADRKKLLQDTAEEVYRGAAWLKPVALAIRYDRKSGRCDGASIIGGVADALQGILYQEDTQVKQLHYDERAGAQERYQVTITELDWV